MNKTQQLIAAVKAGTHRIEGTSVQRRITKDHPPSGTRAGEWVCTSKKAWRADVVRHARVALGLF